MAGPGSGWTDRGASAERLACSALSGSVVLDGMRASEIAELVRAGLGDVAHYELCGGDAVGTDAYPALRDAWPALVESLRSPAADVRVAAAHALAFLVDRAEDVQPALDAALAAADLPFERAAMTLAAGRLRASIARWRGPERPYAWEGVPLSEAARAERSPIVRAAIVIAELWPRPTWNRKVKTEVAAALAVEGECGPWGGGDLGRLATRMAETLIISDAGSNHVRTEPSPDAETRATASEGDIGEDDVDDPYSQEHPVRQPGRIPLAGLHDVAWHELEHAYGDARGVPGMLDALSSPAVADRTWAIRALSASINHQGSVYSASGPAAKFLIELAGHPDVEPDDKYELLLLLVGLAVGDPTWWLFADLEEAASPANDAVAAGGGTFVRLLTHADALVRAAAAYVLSFIPPPEGAATAIQRALAREPDRYTRAALLHALGYVGRRSRSTADRAVLERYLDEDCLFLAAAAAIAIAQIDRASAAPRVRAILARAITDAPPVTGGFAWNGGDLAGFARIVRMEILTIDELLAEYDAAVARGDTKSAHDYAKRALWGAFRDGAHGPERPWIPSELDDRQRRILRALVAIAAPSQGFVEAQLPLSIDDAYAVGLISPTVRAANRLAGEDAGPLDRELELPGGPRPAWFAIGEVVDERLPLAALRAALAELAPADRIAMVEDALAGPYLLNLARSRSARGFDARAFLVANHRTSAFLLVLAALVEDCALVGHGFATALAEAQRPLGKKRDAMRGVLAAIVLAREATARGAEPAAELDALLLPDQAPATTYVRALREVFSHLPPARHARILADLPLFTYRAYRDPRGEVRRWSNGRRWALLDLMPPAAVATEILAALREWERHRAAGDDPHAEPVGGTTTTSHQQKPPPDEDFPRARALELLEACGDAGLEALAAIRASAR